MMRRLLLLSITILCGVVCFAQADRKYIRTGNRFYRQRDFAKAEAEYRKAISANAENAQAIYNLGCALMMQQKDSAAIEQYLNAGKLERIPMRKAKVYHNIGVVCQSRKMYAEAIDAYKESLRNNPDDNETRYNLALCKRLLKNNPQNKNKDNNKNQEKNKNDKDKRNEKDKQKQKDQKQQQNNNEKMSKDNAEQLLNAAMQEEKATQQRVKDAMRQNRTRKLQKNW